MLQNLKCGLPFKLKEQAERYEELHTCKTSIQHSEAGESPGQGQPDLRGKSEASLGYVPRPCVKTFKKLSLIDG